jgi:glucose-1-phosphate cytidylyltransferase
MKVVLFCGGYGMRMRRGVDDDLPKPMQMVGPRPLLWHVMRYYAHYGHTEFVLCLGYGAHHIKEFFLNYTETESNDFALEDGKVKLLSSDIGDWKINFVHTGIDTPIGERLRRVKEYVQDDEMFLANYADVLTDAPLDDMVVRFKESDVDASLMVVPPQQSFHCIDVGPDGKVHGITPVATMPLWENGGYFILKPEIFNHIPENGDLVEDGCGHLSKVGRLLAYQYDGFWQPADTVKERAELDAKYSSGNRPWMVWEQ